jgi:hypothetical protein
MISYENFGWICPDDFVQIYSPDYCWEVARWPHQKKQYHVSMVQSLYVRTKKTGNQCF